MTATTLVGRERELLAIDHMLDQVSGGQRRVLLIAGEPGIGKSRLADELCGRAHARGLVSAWGGAWEAGGAPSFWPWLQLLRALERKLGGLEDPTLIARLSMRSEEAVDASGLNPAADRFGLFDAVARAIESICARNALVLVIDDAHAADVASLGLFEFLARQLRDLPVLLVATYREAEARELEQIDATLGRVRRDASVLRLGALGLDEVRDLVASSVAAARTDAEIGRRVCELTGGSPLFVLEVMRVLEGDPNALAGDGLTSADGLRAAIREHLRLLSPDARAALDAAAVIGREFASSALRALGTANGDSLDLLLAQAVRKGVIAHAGSDRFRFVHVLLRDTLHADLEPLQRAELHARYADWLAAAPIGAATETRAEIAHHLLLAGATRVLDAVDAVRVAADCAVRVLAFEHAVELCTRALEALDVARCAEPERRFELLIQLGMARIHASDVIGGKAACASAAEIARTLPGPEFLARATLAYGSAFVFGTIDPLLVRLCEQSLHALPQHALELRARVLARHAAALQPAEDTRGPVRIARQALALAEQVDNPLAKLSISYAAMSALMDIVDPRERRVLNEQILHSAIELGERGMAVHTRRRLIIDQLDVGDIQGAQRLIDEYAEATRDIKQPHGRWQLPMFRAAIALVQGRFDDQARHVAEAKQLASALGANGIAPATFVLHELISARARGEMERYQAALADVIRLMPPLPYYRDAMVAHAAALRGDHQLARRVLASWNPESIRNHADTMVSAFEAETALALGDLNWARMVRAELEQAQDDMCSWGLLGFAIDGPVTRPLAIVNAVLGDWPAATAYYERARAWCEQTGSWPMLCRVQLDWAELLASRQDPAQAQTAQTSEALARHAATIAREHALPRLLERAQRLCCDAVEVEAPRHKASCSLMREGDVWRLSGLGASCVVRDSRGVAFLARLLEQPDRELHVLDLVGAPEEIRHERAEPLIDARARDAYRTRMQQLREDLEQAEAWQDVARTERAREEIDSLERELARSLGLSGRLRRGSDPAERARVNVQRRIADALSRIRAIEPRLADHLQAAVRTGLFCAYEP
jgi:hypothetical protein